MNNVILKSLAVENYASFADPNYVHNRDRFEQKGISRK